MNDIIIKIALLLIFWILGIICGLIYILFCDIRKLKKTIENSAIWMKLPGKELIPVEKPFITENGADKRLEEFEEKLNYMKEILDKKTSHLRRMKIDVTNLKEKLEDEKLEALSSALDKRDKKQGKQIESNTQRIVNIEKELKEIGKRMH